MRVSREPRFIREFEALPPAIQKRAKKQLALFFQNPRHPSLYTKKMKGKGNIWEGCITREYRFTFEIIDDLFKLRRIGPHNILNRP